MPPVVAPTSTAAPPRPSLTPPLSGPAIGTSITDFLTDGALVALCDEVTKLTGVPIQLRDAAGHLIVRSSGPRPWAVLDSPTPHDSADDSLIYVPIILADRAIGSLTMSTAGPGIDPAAIPARDTLERTLRLLASTVGELCLNERDLQHRVKELEALYRLSSLLVGGTGLRPVINADAILGTVLEIALDALGLDAGSIVMLKADADQVSTGTEEDLILKAARGLSEEWLGCPLPLSKDRLFDRLALRGDLVVSEDIATDVRVLIPDRAAKEGLRSCMHAGLVLQDRPLGVIRLYARRPRTYSDSERRLLRSIAQQAAIAVEQARLHKVQEDDERIQRQLQLAADVQRRMLPRSIPGAGSARFDLAAKYVPSFELGGDFYDLLDLGGHLGVAIGDVVGKGIAAALLMAAVRAALRAYAQDVYDIDEVVARVNIAMCRDTHDSEFATLWYGVVDPRTLRLTYCSAGHEPPLIFRGTTALRAVSSGPSSADIDELSIGGMAVGIDPLQRYQRGTYDLRPRDVLVAYTDGLPDTLDFNGRKFGKPRLRAAVLEILGKEPDAPAAKIIEHVLWTLRQFAGLASRPDDQTIVVLRVKA
jgi:sigma-B regulation protein RsbU (phosphoserine phosphatase)